MFKRLSPPVVKSHPRHSKRVDCNPRKKIFCESSTMLSVLLFSLYFSTITCQDYSPFMLLGVNGPLNGTEFANDNFSPSDKVVTCEMSMTFIDLDGSCVCDTLQLLFD
jgi:hypothetical protein